VAIERSLIDRWRTAQGQELAQDVLARLIAGRDLGDLELGEHQSRIDLRGLPAPIPRRLKRYELKGWFVEELGDLVTLRGARLQRLDLSGGQLQSFRFFHCTIEDCVFDRANCQDWRMWAVDVTHTSFRGTDLRGAALGPWHEGRGNIFREVDFSRSNLKQIACSAATFIDCDLSHAKIARVDFGSTSFIRCKFAGELRDVTFYDHGWRTGKPNPNPMEDVDFSEAILRYVEFRRLNLDRVKFPTGADHFLVHHYRCVLERALEELKKGIPGRAYVETELKWAGSRQEIGVYNRRDLVEVFGDEGAELFERLLIRVESECEEPTLDPPRRSATAPTRPTPRTSRPTTTRKPPNSPQVTSQ
jgi:uncharacterized protein YjbI with pentapeptide repeats